MNRIEPAFKFTYCVALSALDCYAFIRNSG